MAITAQAAQTRWGELKQLNEFFNLQPNKNLTVPDGRPPLNDFSGMPVWAAQYLVASEMGLMEAIYSGDKVKAKKIASELYSHVAEYKGKNLTREADRINALIGQTSEALNVPIPQLLPAEETIGTASQGGVNNLPGGSNAAVVPVTGSSSKFETIYLPKHPELLAQLGIIKDGNPTSKYQMIKRAYDTYGDYNTGNYDDAFTDYLVNKKTLPDGTSLTATPEEEDAANLSPAEIAAKMKVSYEKALRNVVKKDDKGGIVQNYNVGTFNKNAGIVGSGTGDVKSPPTVTPGTPTGLTAGFGIMNYSTLSLDEKIRQLEAKLSSNISPEDRSAIQRELTERKNERTTPQVTIPGQGEAKFGIANYSNLTDEQKVAALNGAKATATPFDQTKIDNELRAIAYRMALAKKKDGVALGTLPNTGS